MTHLAHLAAPGFWLAVSADDEAVTGVEFLTQPPAVWCAAPDVGLLHAAVAQLQAWLADARYRFSLPLRANGTPFRQQVWAQIAAIPYGETRTYGQLAAALHSAPRAIGQACGDNPLPILVPCHRVVGKAGMGGFNHDRGDALLNIKRWLLAHEAKARP